MVLYRKMVKNRLHLVSLRFKANTPYKREFYVYKHTGPKLFIREVMWLGFWFIIHWEK